MVHTRGADGPKQSKWCKVSSISFSNWLGAATAKRQGVPREGAASLANPLIAWYRGSTLDLSLAAARGRGGGR